MRKAALTDVPIMPPTVLKRSNLLDTAAAVAATTIEVMMTILGDAFSLDAEKDPFVGELTLNVPGKKRSQQ